MPHTPLLRRPARALPALALSAILAACTTPPPAKVAAKPSPEHRLPDGVQLALAQRFPDLRVVSDSGDLPGTPGVDAIAVVLGKADGGGEYTVALIAPDGPAGWRVGDVSQPIVPGCAQCSVSADLAPRGLYVRVIRSVGPDFENFTYQFAPGVGSEPWRLVNVTAYVPPRPEDPASRGFSASVDLLSGQRTDISDDASSGTPLHRERQSTVPLRPPIAFGEFSFTANALDAETRALPPVAFDPAGTLPPAAVEALRERFPQMTVQSHATGSLRADGGRDIAAVLVPADRAVRPGAATDAVVAVLLAQPDGGLKLADVSGAMAHDCPTCGVQVQIARRMLSVQTTDISATGSVSTDYQFAFRPKDTALRLVALRTDTTVRGPDGRQKRIDQKSRMAAPPPVPLADFTFDPARLDEDAKPEPAAAAGAPVSGS